MSLDLLPVRSDSAAANMATDFLMLQHYPERTHARFRHYDWRRPACTFGYAQRHAEVCAQLDPTDELELCRRPTGGGIVDHRDDWTYALVIPAAHDLGAAPAPESYAAVHEVIAATLRQQGCPAILQPTADRPAAETPGRATTCFARAEPADVIHQESKIKLAGAAQKRAKRGLLLQGSLSRGNIGPLDWHQFEFELVEGLSRLLDLPVRETPMPEAWDEAVDTLAEDYTSEAWLKRR